MSAMSAFFPCSRHPLSDLTMGNIFQREEDSNLKQAPGPDGIPQRGLKDCELNETLYDILKTSFQEGI